MGRIFVPEWLRPGDGIRVKSGAFEGYEGEVVELLPEQRRVRVTIVIFGKATTVELEFGRIEFA